MDVGNNEKAEEKKIFRPSNEVSILESINSQMAHGLERAPKQQVCNMCHLVDWTRFANL